MAELDSIYVPLQPDAATGYFCALRYDDLGPAHRPATGWCQVQGCAGPACSSGLRVSLSITSTATCLTWCHSYDGFVCYGLLPATLQLCASPRSKTRLMTGWIVLQC